MHSATSRLLISLSVLALSGAPAAAATLTLVERGQPKATVVTGSNPSGDERSATEELVRYVEKATGAVLPVSAGAPRDSTAIRIHIGLSACHPAARTRVEGLKADGYLVEVLPGGQVILAGKGRHGTSFAVYEFLERFADIRWLWPGDLGEVVPQRSSLLAEIGSDTREPAFLWRDLGPGGALWGPADRWQKESAFGISSEHQTAQRTWERRNRFGGQIIYGGHAFGEMVPPARYGPVHPEYFALYRGVRDWQNFNGKHRSQLCTSNPEVVRLVAEYCRRKFQEHPEYDAVAISPNDGRGFCECEKCQRLDTGQMQEDQADPETGKTGSLRIISDRMTRFGNDVAEAVAKTHPAKKVILFAYGQYRRPPVRTKGHPNLIIQYAVNGAGFWSPEQKKQAYEDLEGWSRAVQNAGVYEYFTQGNFPDIPRLIPDLISMELRDLHKMGYRYFQTQAGNGFSVNGLNFYVLARLLWDPTADYRAIIADYVRAGFGEAAPAVSRYFHRHIERWKEMRSETVKMNGFSIGDYESVLGVYPAEFRDACRADLEEAMRLARGADRKRVDFLRQGFAYWDMTMRAAEKSLPLVRAGWKPAAGTAYSDPARLKSAIEAWEELERFVEQHREDFVLSYLWVRYNYELRGFNPLGKFRAAAGKPSR